MDVKPGLCWRCEIRLQNNKEVCFLCETAVYCSTQCMERDEARHGSVECKMWSRINKCDACGRLGRMKQCSGCYTASYCDKICQEFAWKTHKSECTKWTEKILAVAVEKRRLHLKDSPFTSDSLEYPFYFGNNMAFDLLRLPDQSSGSFEEGEENALVQNFNLLLASCGNLRNITQTIYSLPVAYAGKLSFLLNDVDPFVMARNVLLLYMMATCIDSVSIATIWLSTRLPENSFNHLQNSLNALITSDRQMLRDLTNDAVRIDDETLSVLSQVWKGWKKLQCRIGAADCIDLHEQRLAVFRKDFTFAFIAVSYRDEVDVRYLPSIDKWFTDGIIISPDQHETKLLFFNPTLTGRPETVVKSIEVRSPLDWEFQYCVKPSCMPITSWDFLDLIKDEQTSSVTTLLHLFVAKCVQKTISLLMNDGVVFEINIDNFVKLKSKLPRSRWNFDRIFTSNLADFYGIDCLLRHLGPMLSPSNHHATLFMSYMNWPVFVSGTIKCEGAQGMNDSRVLSAMKDLGIPSVKGIQKKGDCYSQEYSFNVPHFINYLRGEKLGVSDSFRFWHESSGETPTIPSWSNVTNCHGLRMRHFRKHPNKIVPVCLRVNARVVSLPRSFDRFLEWYRPSNDPSNCITQ